MIRKAIECWRNHLAIFKSAILQTVKVEPSSLLSAHRNGVKANVQMAPTQTISAIEKKLYHIQVYKASVKNVLK